MSKLLSSIRIGKFELKNRIVISPMCQYSANDGFANDWHLVHLGSRAIGRAALIIQEATAVSPEGRISYGDLGLWKDEHIEKLKQIVDFLHSQGSLAGIQLAHAGRKASSEKPWNGGGQIKSNDKNGWITYSASPKAFKEGQEPPVELDHNGIEQVITDFKEAAKRAVKASYDVIEIHAAHGYLLHQFYSPLSNHRRDEYGGSFENRIRLTLEVVDSVKSTMTEDQLLFVRISATDWIDGAWDIEDSIKLVKILKERGVHVIDTSTGGNQITNIPAEPNYQVPFAAQIKNETGILTGCVGLINTPQQAEQILQNDEADLILIARESLRNPHFPLYAGVVLDDEIDWPSQYERAFPKHGEWK